MKIQVNTKPIAKAKINLVKFSNDLKKNFDIYRAVLDNTIITQCGPVKEKTVLEYIYQGSDWGNLLMLWKEARQDEMTITIYPCKVIGWTIYDPQVLDPAKGTFDLKPRKIDIDDVLVTNSFNPRIDKHIEFMLSQNIIDYANKKWNIAISFE